MTDAERNKRLLGSLLIEKGLIAEAQLERALTEQKQQNTGRLGYWLVRLGLVPAVTLATFLNEYRYIAPFLEPPAIRRKASQKIPRFVAYYYKIAPLKKEQNVLTVALAEVQPVHFVEMLSEITGCRIDALMLPEKEIRSLIESTYGTIADPGVELLTFDDHTFSISDSRKNIKPLAPAQLKQDAEIGDRLRSLIAEAIKEKSREILIKPEPDQTQIFFKKEAFRKSEFHLTSRQHEDVTFLLFQLAKMNLLRQNAAQHGQFVVKINDRKISMLVNAVPTMYGIRFLLEMFDEKVLKHSFDELLKPFPETRKHIEEFLIETKKGVLAITGPEGSGRTRFLYSLLTRAKEFYGNIHTLEAAIRYPVNGIHQNEVPEQMERMLEDYLYQSPDLLAIAPARTVRAAEIAFLLASRIPVILLLSSYDAYIAVEWLCRHNLKSAVKAGLLHTVVSPRTIPRLCPHCSVPYNAATESVSGMNLPPGTQLKMNQGCEQCRNQETWHSETFFESFRINEEAIRWILQDHSSSYLRNAARTAGRNTLYDLVVRDAFSDHLDMLSIARLHATL